MLSCASTSTSRWRRRWPHWTYLNKCPLLHPLVISSSRSPSLPTCSYGCRGPCRGVRRVEPDRVWPVQCLKRVRSTYSHLHWLNIPQISSNIRCNMSHLDCRMSRRSQLVYSSHLHYMADIWPQNVTETPSVYARFRGKPLDSPAQLTTRIIMAPQQYKACFVFWRTMTETKYQYAKAITALHSPCDMNCNTQKPSSILSCLSPLFSLEFFIRVSSRIRTHLLLPCSLMRACVLAF